MNSLDSLLFNVSQMCGTTLPRIIALMAGLIVLFLSVSSLWTRRLKALPAFMWIVISSLMIIISVNTDIVHLIAGAAYLTKIRLMIGLLSAGVLMITLESIRRSHLQERYAILWVGTGVILLLCAMFPGVLKYISDVFGTQYVTSVVAVVFTFLILVAFHFSISMSDFSENHSKVTQRVAILEAKLKELQGRLDAVNPPVANSDSGNRHEPDSVPVSIPAGKRTRGSNLVITALIAGSFIGILATGIMAGSVMIGDEVTHYYMLAKQSDNLSVPNFQSVIPTATGASNERQYPHAFGWHYAGAIVYRYFGQSLASVQFYHALFFVQLLLAAFLLARSRGGIQNKSAIVYLFTLASIPMVVIFSVAFYQDVPVAAQVLTAFYLLSVRRSAASMIFMLLAVMMKETAILFVPIYLILMAIWDVRFKSIFRATVNVLVFVALLAGMANTMDKILLKYADSSYYPTMTLRKYIACFTKDAPEAPRPCVVSAAGEGNNVLKAINNITPYEVEIIANHPGDLRDVKNYFIYGGILIWLVAVLGIIGWLTAGCTCGTVCSRPSSRWLWGVGFYYLIVCGYLIRSAPDARFFLPALPFILLPLCENLVRLSRRREIVAIVAALAILQYGEVLAKTYKLRNVPEALTQGMDYLREHNPPYNNVFMYPEGNYRLFPCSHEWYLNYKLREFWKGDNNTRIKMLNDHHIGAIVIKKHLISPVDDKITNLGVYPDYFVRDIQKDNRFTNVFDNSAVSIYTFPVEEKDEGGNLKPET